MNKSIANMAMFYHSNSGRWVYGSAKQPTLLAYVSTLPVAAYQLARSMVSNFLSQLFNLLDHFLMVKT